jgi:hypothetical protein
MRVRSATVEATIQHLFENYAQPDNPYRFGAAVLGGVPLAALVRMGAEPDNTLDAVDEIIESLDPKYVKPATRIKEARLSHELYRNGLASAVHQASSGKLVPPEAPGDLIFILADERNKAVIIEPVDEVVIFQAILPRQMNLLLEAVASVENFRERWALMNGITEQLPLPDFDVAIGYDPDDDTYIVHLRVESCGDHLVATATDLITFFSTQGA